MATLYNIMRGTRSSLSTLISQAKIVPGREYLLTDENRVVVGTSTTTVVELLRRADDYLDLNNLAPGLPATGTTRLYRADVGGRGMLRITGPAGDFHTAQSHFGRNNMGLLVPAFGSAAYSSYGFSGITALGTATARTWASSSRFTRSRRVGFVSAATANSTTGYYVPTVLASTGDTTSGGGGFHYMIRFGISDASLVASCKMFLGMANTVAAPGTGEISTLTQHIGVGKLSSSNNLCVYSAGTAAQSVTDLGTSYPANTTNTDLYEFILFSPSSTSAVSWSLTRFLSNGTSTTTGGTFGSPGSAAPDSTIGLAPRAWRLTPAATAVGLDIVGMYLETDI